MPSSAKASVFSETFFIFVAHNRSVNFLEERELHHVRLLSPSRVSRPFLGKPEIRRIVLLQNHLSVRRYKAWHSQLKGSSHLLVKDQGSGSYALRVSSEVQKLRTVGHAKVGDLVVV